MHCVSARGKSRERRTQTALPGSCFSSQEYPSAQIHRAMSSVATKHNMSPKVAVLFLDINGHHAIEEVTSRFPVSQGQLDHSTTPTQPTLMVELVSFMFTSNFALLGS